MKNAMDRYLKNLLVIITILIASGCDRQTVTEQPLPRKRPNILLIVVDTLAAKHLGSYRPELTHSPNIDRLGRDGVVFEKAISPAPWTKPAVASIFTGLLPSQHGVRALNSHLSSEQVTLAERLKGIGYQTGGFISHTFINEKNGYAQGFDRYEIFPFTGNVHKAVSSEHVSNLALNWLKERSEAKNEPFFLFLHYFDPHYNYQHHPQFSRTEGYQGQLKPGMDIRKLRKLIPKLTAEDLNYLIGLYHEEIAFTDQQIGRVVEYLKESGVADDTLIVVTADHGEEFLEHGYIGHTRTLYDELIRVPLIVRWGNEIKKGRVVESVSTADITPTILDITGIEAGNLDGVSLLGMLRGEVSGGEPRDIYSEVDFRSSGIEAYKLGLVNNEWKFVLDKKRQAAELLNLLQDPGEKRSVLDREPKRGAEMEGKVFNYRDTKQSAGVNEDAKAPETPEEVEQLKSLGYL